ncbi:MAG: DUF2809 domain-containing protein [Bacteroidota bacterium]
MIRFHKTYFLLAVLLFITEVLIALYVKDAIIRPYVGDFLVVMLVYCFLRAFLNISLWPMAIFTLLFAYAVEFAQYLNMLKWLGLENNRFARIVLGSSFEWIDMLAYTLGVVFIILVEKYLIKK